MTTVKGKKRTRGQAVHWNELKKNRTLTLTESTWTALEAIGNELGGLSRSEAIEHWVRGQLPSDNSSVATAPKDTA